MSSRADRHAVIFTIIVYFGVKHGQITSFVPTVVAITLPLSAMWAAVNTSHAHLATPHKDSPGHILVGNPNLDTKSSGCSCGKNSTLFTNTTLIDDKSSGGASPKRGWSMARSSNGNGGDRDLEMGRLTDDRGLGNVVVDRTYTVTSD